MSEVMVDLLRQHLVDAARPNVTGLTSGFETVTAAVGFVDVVGSTGLAQHLPLGDIGTAIGVFEEHAADVVAANNGRVVKFIGDEVMFRVHDPAAACRIALDDRGALLRRRGAAWGPGGDRVRSPPRQ